MTPIDRRGRTHAQYRSGGVQLAFGEEPTGRIVHVSTVPDGAACGCVCPACGAPLVARQGSRRRHFAHRIDTACASARETMLHKLAKQILQDHKRLLLPAVAAETDGVRRVAHRAKDFAFDEVEAEVAMGDLVPDVVLRKGARKLFVEIWVTHACDAEKLAKLEAARVSTLEIDLRKTPRFASLAEIEAAVLREAPRAWLVNPHLDVAREQVRAVLEAREAARVAKLERKAAQVAAALDQGLRDVEDEAHGALADDAERLQRLGYGQWLGLRSRFDRAFAVSPRLWQAWLLKACLLPRSTWHPGDATVSARAALSAMRRQGLVAPMFMEDFDPDVLGRVRRLRPDLRTPSELINGYLKHLEKGGHIEATAAGWKASAAARTDIEAKVEARRASDGRRDELLGRAESLLRLAGIPSRDFDLPVWSGAAASGGKSFAAIAEAGGPDWEALRKSVSALETAFYNDGETPDCLGLPVAAAIRASADARQVAAERKREEAEARRQAAMVARGERLTHRAVELLGPEAAPWLDGRRASDNASRLEAATRSEDLFNHLSAKLEEAGRARADRLAKARAAEQARSELRRRVISALGEERAAVFLMSTQPLLGAHPLDYCVDERTLAECLGLLPSPKGGRRR